MSPSGTAKTFLQSYGLTVRQLEDVLGEALGRRADFADLYFEATTTEEFLLEDSALKKVKRDESRGMGVRVVVRERTGYAYSDEVSLERLRSAAATARAISHDADESRFVAIASGCAPRNLYPVSSSPLDASVSEKTGLLSRVDTEARRFDPRIRNVIATLVCQQKKVFIATSDGAWVVDERPLVRLQVTCLAGAGGALERGSFGGGGRVGFDFLLERDPIAGLPRYCRYAREAARQALVNLDAVEAPAGPQIVVLASGWPGILIHEAVGHGLEGDFNRKGISAFSGRLGERVASPLCTVVDDGTLPFRRGSLNVDDEGTLTGRTVLIEKGILRGYLQDRRNARLMGMPVTGNGRRESFAHAPMPRMTNTFLLPGEEDPEDIIRSVDRGLYAVDFGGGQVDITSGTFVFSATEAYEIENGRIARPVKGATLIGSGPEVLQRITRVGTDLRFDEGIGTCGKNRQSVPVGNGMPTVRIDGLTVGGTRR
jgi:TldD protein